jgi:hypothetical protein
MRRSSFAVAALVTTASLVSFAGDAAAQKPLGTVVVTAKDSTGAPVAGAELTLTRGLKDIVARATTDDNGRGVMSLEVKDSSDAEVTMRKIGYARGDHFFSVGPYDTAHVTITVAHNQTTLAPVEVTAKKKDLRWSSYHLDADEIEASNEPIDDAFDVIKRLRPVMLTSRGGCPTGVREVWVNGKRIRLPLPPTREDMRRARVGAPISARFSPASVSILSQIAPEHIAEINYHDCFDASMAAVGNNDAVFVTLKPGVVFQENGGSYVLDEPTMTKRNAK